ncbi:MAG: DUF481 domain-containing protein [Proteobacteria bacterium]|nr:MAG: DUF481 domain-containing protein [Pseudomonadota bacterium]
MKRLLVALMPLLIASAWAEDGLKNESELGYVLTSGNTKVSTLTVKEKSAYTLGLNTIAFTGSYLTSKNQGVTSAKNWNLGLRLERALSERFSIFIGQAVLGDRFQQIKQRYNSDLGGKYFIMKEDTLNWFAELGYRFTKENATVMSRNFHYIRAYTEIEKKWNESVSTKYWIEYLPNFTESEDYLINTELSLNAMLNSVFSVKTGYLVRFDGQPAAGVPEKTDTVFTTALVAKF